MLKEQLQSDTNDSLKQGNHEVTGVLRLALAAIGAKEKEKRYKISKEYSEIKEEELILASALTDDEVIGVLSQKNKKKKKKKNPFFRKKKKKSEGCHCKRHGKNNGRPDAKSKGQGG